jgi:hypothetical protein
MNDEYGFCGICGIFLAWRFGGLIWRTTGSANLGWIL